jgi:Zn-dependent peptidase ImmA (M78 family)
VNFLRRYITFPPVGFPDFGLPDDPTAIRRADIEQVAEKVRRSWKLGDGPISNVAWLLENNGAVLSRQELGADELDAFSQWSDADHTPYIVLGSDKSSGPRSRFDAGHELGHMILHRKFKKPVVLNNPLYRLMEQQAHAFSSAFLLPAASFSLECHRPTLDLFRALKPKWKVSIQLMIRRSGELGYLSEQESRRLWINLARRGWRLQEPLDDSLDHEMPRFLRRSFELLVEKGIIARNEIPFQLRLAASDIESLSNLRKGYFFEPVGQDEPEPVLKFPRIQAQG